jgi:HK97 family phage prohead protease
VPLLVGHAWDNISRVAGKITSVRADDVGLFVAGEFTTDEVGQSLRAKALAGAVIGLSVGGLVIEARGLPGGVRELLKVDLAHIAVTNSPGMPGAAITAAKSEPGTLPGHAVDVTSLELESLEAWAHSVEVDGVLASMASNPPAIRCPCWRKPLNVLVLRKITQQVVKQTLETVPSSSSRSHCSAMVPDPVSCPAAAAPRSMSGTDKGSVSAKAAASISARTLGQSNSMMSCQSWPCRRYR